MFHQILTQVKSKQPIIHCITNYVSANDCANIILAAGGSPVMADDITEVEEIVSAAHALVLNLGTLSEARALSMVKAGQKANSLGIPVILDPVGVGASRFRKHIANELLNQVSFSVIRGNASEIRTLATWQSSARGIDTCIQGRLSPSDSKELIKITQTLSQQTGAIIVVSGAEDMITSHEQTYLVHNGHPSMTRITGTGCMLSSVIGTYCGANPDCLLEATLAAVGAMGLSGEEAYERLNKTDEGTGTLRILLIDAMSLLSPMGLEGGLKYALQQTIS